MSKCLGRRLVVVYKDRVYPVCLFFHIVNMFVQTLEKFVFFSYALSLNSLCLFNVEYGYVMGVVANDLASVDSENLSPFHGYSVYGLSHVVTASLAGIVCAWAIVLWCILQWSHSVDERWAQVSNTFIFMLRMSVITYVAGIISRSDEILVGVSQCSHFDLYLASTLVVSVCGLVLSKRQNTQVSTFSHSWDGN